MNRTAGRAGAFLLAALFATAGSAQNAPAPGGPPAAERLLQLEQQLELSRLRQQTLVQQAQDLARELSTLRSRLVLAANAIQSQEEQIAAITARLEPLKAEEAAKAGALESEQAELAKVLGTLTRIAREPAAALMAARGDALDQVRASVLLAALVPALEQRAGVLNRDLEQARGRRSEIAAEQAALKTATALREAERANLQALLDQRTTERTQTLRDQATEQANAGKLADQAFDLRALIERLDAAAPDDAPPEGTRPFADARGRLSLPVRGTVTGGYGQRDPLGIPAQGITISALADAAVVAPYDGRIVFAGPFRSYGQLLIISHGGGYHTLIAGLSRIDGQVGQWLLAGEPVAQASHGENGKSAVYVELRRNGEPINPSPWLAAR